MEKTMAKRKVTDKELMEFKRIVDHFISKMVLKCWKGSSLAKDKENCVLGNTGMTVSDVRQYLLLETFIALSNFKEDRNTKPSTFVYKHLTFRTSQLLTSLCSKRRGYGISHSEIDWL